MRELNDEEKARMSAYKKAMDPNTVGDVEVVPGDSSRIVDPAFSKEAWGGSSPSVGPWMTEGTPIQPGTMIIFREVQYRATWFSLACFFHHGYKWLRYWWRTLIKDYRV